MIIQLRSEVEMRVNRRETIIHHRFIDTEVSEAHSTGKGTIINQLRVIAQARVLPQTALDFISKKAKMPKRSGKAGNIMAKNPMFGTATIPRINPPKTPTL